MIDNRQCEQWHREKGINVIIYDEMVCAGYFHGGKVIHDRYNIVDIMMMVIRMHKSNHGFYRNL